jgi:hypothetical protein
VKRRLSVTVLLLSIGFLYFTLAAAQFDSGDRLIDERLASLSSPSGQAIDCGTTGMYKPDEKVSRCAEVAFNDHRPFRALYSDSPGPFHRAYGLAGDGQDHVYEVLYDSRGLLNLGLRKNSQVFSGNQIRVTTCIRPIRLGRTETGMLACLTPVDEQGSEKAALQKPINTTVCAILKRPSAFNNKLVRVHGYVSGNFEYSNLGADGCSDSIWFAYAGGEGPPGLIAYVTGGAIPGTEDTEGRLVLPVPVKLVKDSNFLRFEKLMRARAEANEQSLKENGAYITLYRVAATFVGRIDGVSDDVHAFHLKRKDTDLADFLGFGQMGLFDAQFVLQSVEGDAVLEKFPPMANPMAPSSKSR